MNEGTIICPNCRKPFELTTVMAAGIEMRVRAEMELEAGKRLRALEAREKDATDKFAQVERARGELEAELDRRFAAERSRLADELRKQAREDADLEVKLLKDRLAENGLKLEDARRREESLLRKETDLAERVRAIEREVTERLEAERKGLYERARSESASLVGAQVKALEEDLARGRAKVAQAEAAELALRKEKAALEDQRRALDLERQRAIDAERTTIREKARTEADEAYRLKVMEKDKIIEDMQKKLEEAKRKGDQGSQQLQGEVQEIDLEAMLRVAFPVDQIEAVGKGQNGADLIQKIMGPGGGFAGSILWESKRTKNWGSDWVEKLKDDQREAGASIAAIVSSALPKGMETFGPVDGVWVTGRPCSIPLAVALRSGIIKVSEARKSVEGKHSKMELVYGYLTGDEFRHRVEAIKEAFESMHEDLESEKKVFQKQWAKREKEIETVISNTVGLWGDLQGIAGKNLPTIEGLEPMGLLEAPEHKGGDRE